MNNNGGEIAKAWDRVLLSKSDLNFYTLNTVTAV